MEKIEFPICCAKGGVSVAIEEGYALITIVCSVHGKTEIKKKIGKKG